MQYSAGSGRGGQGTRQAGSGAGPGFADWIEEEKPRRDWRKVVLIVGLGILSWVATYVGMLELIEANLGDLPLMHKLIVGFSVAMLMIMIVWLLDQLFAPLPFFTKLLYAIGYVFLTLISVGFGFGFYWKVLESRGEASRSAEGAVGQVQGSLLAASTRLDQLQATLDQLTTISRQKADNERASGTSCPASRAGDGPRRKMRDDDAARFEFAGNFVKGRAGHVKTEIAALDADLVRITRNDASIVDPRSGTRNEFMKGLGRKLDNTVTGFNAFRTDPQLKQIRADLAERADRTVFPDSRGGTYACPDPQLSGALKGVVRAIDGLPELEKPKIATVEGSEATIEAFRRLIATFHGMMTFKLPPSADEQRELQKRAVQSVENPQAAARFAAAAELQPGLSKRDYVPLAVALFVDLCLLLVSMGRPMNRLQNLVPKMRAAERGPVIQILSRFSEIHRDEGMRECFEVLRHVVFDYAGAYYVAVPLDAPYIETRREQVIDPATRKAKLVTKQFGIPQPRRDELRVEAHLLANLFASFEKDKVFKRVMWLNTDSARRRLAAQGSKFATAEAFRIYRFGDGAWSEIILGAVMGAARRVEQKRAADPDAYGRREPTLDALFDRMRQAEVEAQLERHAPQPKSPAFVERRRGPGPIQQQAYSEAAEAEIAARFGPYASRVQAERLDPAGFPISPPANANTYPQGRYAAATEAAGFSAPEALPDVGNIVPFKAQPQMQPQPQTPFHPVGSAEADADERAEMRLPAFMTRGQAALAQAPVTEPAVTVIATERKLSFELPMNDPRLSRGLYGANGLLAASSDAATRIVEAPTIQSNLPPVVSQPDGPERHTALILPAPIREHEHRG
jgi:hypothetical protein